MSEGDSLQVPDKVYTALRRSGFPFQTAVAEVVQHGSPWQLVATEYPWVDPSGIDQFLDLAATHGNLCATIECKKSEKEVLVFLRPRGLSKTVEEDRARVLFTTQIRDMTKRLETYCGEHRIQPTSYESQFCVVGTDSSGKSQRLLERDARLLVQATDAFALDRQGRLDPEARGGGKPDLPFIYLPLLVTNAPIFTTRYHAGEISLDTGQFAEDPELEPVDFLRFRKSFSSRSGADLGERTVFVVRATALGRFLAELNAIQTEAEDRGRAHLPRRRS